MNAPRLWRLALALVFATIADYATRIALKLERLHSDAVAERMLLSAQSLAQEMDDEMGPVTEAELEELRKVWPCCRG